MSYFNTDQLEQDAVSRTGLTDFGPSRYQQNLMRLTESLQQTGGLSERGMEQTRKELLKLLCNRLEIQDWLGREPDILAEAIDAPVFATGLPRSGTTLLLHLFDHDPRLQLLRTWEGSQPCPPPGYAPETIASRIDKTRQSLASVWQQSVPGFDAIHLIDVEGPDECTSLLNNDFNQVGFFNYLNVPDYFDWMVKHGDFDSSYRFHKQQLQLLQWRRPMRRWVLKYPNHLLALDAIQSVHESARFVITHRDPVKTLASLCNLTANFRGGRYHAVDRDEIGRQMLSFVKTHIDHLLAFSKTYADRMFDVDYYALVADPLSVMEQVYQYLSMEMPASVHRQITHWIAENPQGKRGDHQYELASFGLERAQVEEQFADYRRQYNIPVEDA